MGSFDDEETEIMKEQIPFAVSLIQEFIIGGYKYMADSFSRNSKLINESGESETEEKP